MGFVEIDVRAWLRARSDLEVMRYIKNAIDREGTVEFWGFGRTARRQMMRVGYALGQEGFGILFWADRSGRTEMRMGSKEGLDARAISWPRDPNRRSLLSAEYGLDTREAG